MTNISNLALPTLFIAAGAAVALYTQRSGCECHKQFKEQYPKIEQAVRGFFGGIVGYLSLLSGKIAVQQIQSSGLSAKINQFVPESVTTGCQAIYGKFFG